MPRNEVKYQIVKTTYKFKTDGQVDDNGRLICEKIGEPKTGLVKGVSNFKELKQSLKKLSDEDKNVTVHYKDRTYTEKLDKFGRTTSIRRNPAQVDFVTKKCKDGTYEKTYYSVKRK